MISTVFHQYYGYKLILHEEDSPSRSLLNRTTKKIPLRQAPPNLTQKVLPTRASPSPTQENLGVHHIVPEINRSREPRTNKETHLDQKQVLPHIPGIGREGEAEEKAVDRGEAKGAGEIAYGRE